MKHRHSPISVIVFGLVIVVVAALCSAVFFQEKAGAQATPSSPYHFVGFSQMHVQGGSTLHHINAACVGSFGAGTRMCTTTEYYTSPKVKVPAPGSGGAWVDPVFVASYYDPVRETGMCVDSSGLALPCGPLSWNCNNWSLAAITTNPPTTVYGSVIAPPGGTAGSGFVSTVSCAESLPVTCCAR